MTEIDLNDTKDLTALLISSSLKSMEGTRNVYNAFRRLRIKAVEHLQTQKIHLTQLTEEEANRTNDAGLWFFGG